MNDQPSPQNPSSGGPESFPGTLARARGGDVAAIDALCRAYYPRVNRMVHARLQGDLRSGRPWLISRFSTGDIVQEVFRGALADLDAFAGDSEQAFTAYLSMLVHNRLIDALRFHEAARRDGRRPAVDIEGQCNLFGSAEDPAESAQTNEELARFNDVMSGFEKREQLLLRARLDGSASFESLAEQLGYSSGDSARRAFYAVQASILMKLRTR